MREVAPPRRPSPSSESTLRSTIVRKKRNAAGRPSVFFVEQRSSARRHLDEAAEREKKERKSLGGRFRSKVTQQHFRVLFAGEPTAFLSTQKKPAVVVPRRVVLLPPQCSRSRQCRSPRAQRRDDRRAGNKVPPKNRFNRQKRQAEPWRVIAPFRPFGLRRPAGRWLEKEKLMILAVPCQRVCRDVIICLITLRHQHRR